MENFYISTSPIPANKKPELYSVMELLRCDVLARHKRRNEKDVYFLVGIDDYGDKILKETKEKNKKPISVANETVFDYRVLIEKMNISNDFLIRTTDEDLHRGGVQKVWMRLEENGDIYKKKHKGLWCKECDAFLESENIIDNKCKEHFLKVEEIEEVNYFFQITRYQKSIKRLIEKDLLVISPKEKKKEILSFLDSGLKDISISRDANVFFWGSLIRENEDQKVSPFFEALLTTLTGVGYKDERREYVKYWPASICLIKENLYLQSTALLLATLLSLKLEAPKRIVFYGENRVKKISKKINLDELIDNYEQDFLRYYFLSSEIDENANITEEMKEKQKYFNKQRDYLLSLAKKVKLKKEVPSKEVFEKIEELRGNLPIFLDNLFFQEAIDSVFEVIGLLKKDISNKDFDYIFLSFIDLIFPFLPKLSKELLFLIEENEK